MMSEQQRQAHKPDRQEIIWRAVRRALLMIVSAIEAAYNIERREQ